MHKSPSSQRFFVDGNKNESDIRWLQELSGQRLLQFEQIEQLNWKIIGELRCFCRELSVNYKKRFLVQDKFLSQVENLNCRLITQVEMIHHLMDAIDSFCGGDINAVEEINGN